MTAPARSLPQPDRHQPDQHRPDVVPLRPAVPVASTQGTLALDLQARVDPPVPVHDRRPGLDAWVHRFVQAATEIVGGDRPASQLVRWTSREVYIDLERRAELVARAGLHQVGVARVHPVRPRVLSVHSCPVDRLAVEASAHVRYGERSRALALRFERRRGRDGLHWVCTALEWG